MAARGRMGEVRLLSTSFVLLWLFAVAAFAQDMSAGEGAQGGQFIEAEANRPADPPSNLVREITRLTGREGGISPLTNSWGIVRRRGVQFITPDRKKFFVNGYNAWILPSRGSTPEGKQRVINLLDAGNALGLTVARVMLANLASFVFQSGPTNVSEAALKDFDWLMAECAKRKIRLLVMLGNNWTIKRTYRAWLPASEKGDTDDVFFTNPTAKGWFKGVIQKILTRTNSVNNVKYSEDPTIFAWQLLNEPRCTSDKTGRSLISWIDEMSTFVKSLDSNHMVSVGSEGFYGFSRPQRIFANPGPGWPAEQGNDVIAEHLVKNIDFITVHAYAQLWMGGSDVFKIVFADKWLKAHIEDGQKVIRKPMVVEEFGWMWDIPKRDLLFRQVYGYSLNATTSGYNCGTMFWMFEDHNGTWNVNMNTDKSTLELAKEHSVKLQKLPK